MVYLMPRWAWMLLILAAVALTIATWWGWLVFAVVIWLMIVSL